MMLSEPPKSLGTGFLDLVCRLYKTIVRDARLTHRPLSSSFLGIPYRILNISHKKELLRRLWVGISIEAATDSGPDTHLCAWKGPGRSHGRLWQNGKRVEV